MGTRGDLVFHLDVDNTGYRRGLDEAVGRLPSFERSMRDATERLNGFERASSKAGKVSARNSGRFRGAGMAALELSRGVEDAAAVYGTMGLSGAIRASSNNISQFASLIHPAAGAVTGLAVAAGTLLIPKLFETEDAARKASNGLKELEHSAERVSQRVAGLRSELSIDRARIEVESVRSPDQLQDIARTSRLELEDIGAARSATMSELQRLARPFLGENVEFLGASNQRDHSRFRDELLPSMVGGTKFSEIPSETSDRILELERELFDLHRESRLPRERMLAAERALPGAEREAFTGKLEQKQERDRQLEAAAQREQRTRDSMRTGLERALRDELDPRNSRQNEILDRLRERREQINGQFGGDAELMSQAEESARRQLLDRNSPQSLPDGAPIAAARGSSEAVSLINRSANDAVPVAKQQLAEQRKMTARIERLIQETKRRPDLPPAGVGGGS